MPLDKLKQRLEFDEVIIRILAILVTVLLLIAVYNAFRIQRILAEIEQTHAAISAQHVCKEAKDVQD